MSQSRLQEEEEEDDGLRFYTLPTRDNNQQCESQLEQLGQKAYPVFNSEEKMVAGLL